MEIRDENDEKAGFATVLIRWTGGETGEVLLEDKKDGKVDVKFGSFSTSPLTFSVDGVWLDGYVYMPSLDQKPSTIVIEGP